MPHNDSAPIKTGNRASPAARSELMTDEAADDLQVMAGHPDLPGAEIHQPHDRFPEPDEHDADQDAEDEIDRNGERRDPACLLLQPRADILGDGDARTDADEAEHEDAEENNLVGESHRPRRRVGDAA